MLIKLMIFLFPIVLLSQSISSLSGSIAHDSTLVINGSSFGSKSQAAPVAWDNLEDGSANTTATVGTWGSVGYPSEIVSASTNEQRSVNSTYNLYADVPGNGNEYAAFRMSSGGAAKWFIQYWFLVGDNWDFEDGNIKIMRLWASSTSNLRVQGPINAVDVVVETSDQSHGGYDDTGCDGGGWVPVTSSYNTVDDALGHTCSGETLPGSVHWRNYESDIDDGEWHCFQWEYAEGSAANGVLRWWFDGTLIFDHDDITTGNTNKYPFIVGWYMSNSSDGNGDFYLVDAYIDNTWARVEIGDNQIYNNCSHREIQIPTAWSSSEITVTINQGTFAAEETAYLFVVDSDGDVSSGYEIEIGGTASGSGSSASQKKTDVSSVTEESN